MPFYEYAEGGGIVERLLPIAARDNFPGRITVPRRVAVCPRGEGTQGERVLQGWKECEEKDGTEAVRQTAAELGMTREQVKQLWLAPDPPEPRYPEG